MKELSVETNPIRNGVKLRLNGELQFSDAKDFMHVIPAQVRNRGRYVVLDMKDLDFIDSAGLGAILFVSEACRMQSQVVQVANPNVQVLNSLKSIHNVGNFEIMDVL